MPKIILRNRQRSLNYLSVGLILFSAIYGIQAYNLNQQLKKEIAVLGSQSSSGSSVVLPGAPSAEGLTGNPTIPDEEPPTEEQVYEYNVAPDAPRYLKIPKFGLTARIMPVGQADDGTIDVPDSIYDVGWYNKSRQATDDSGAMFLVGHVSGSTNAGVFFKLGQLGGGDRVIVEMGNGDEIQFNVFEKNEYELANVDMARALSSSDSHTDRLNVNLMTCSGDFDVDSFTYDKRLMVSAVKA